jgi:hypothetical protein
MLFTKSLVMIFIITILLLAADFYYLKNIAGRRLVGLRWWNEVDLQTGDSQWVFESSEPGTKTVNATDSRFFWLALYSQPVLWVGLSIVAFINLKFIWLPLVGESLFPSSLSFSLLLLLQILGFCSYLCAGPESLEKERITGTGGSRGNCLSDLFGGNYLLMYLCSETTAIAFALTVTNALAFSRCDKFSQASNMAGSALYSGNLAGSIASNMVGRLFTFGR